MAIKGMMVRRSKVWIRDRRRLALNSVFFDSAEEDSSGRLMLYIFPNLFTSQNSSYLVRKPIRIERFAEKTIETRISCAIHLISAGFRGHSDYGDGS
jgi:hypothetical protein